MVAGSLIEAGSEGIPSAILFTPEDNHAARRAYESLGFKQHSDYRILLLREGIEIAR